MQTTFEYGLVDSSALQGKVVFEVTVWTDLGYRAGGTYSVTLNAAQRFGQVPSSLVVETKTPDYSYNTPLTITAVPKVNATFDRGDINVTNLALYTAFIADDFPDGKFCMHACICII